MIIIKKIKYFWTGSIRRQLIIGIALVHAVLMTIFVLDLVTRQSNFLHEQTIEQAGSLAKTLAANSTSWILASDVVGLEEVINSQSNYPSLRYAMIHDLNGKILGYTDRRMVGKYIDDATSLSLLDHDMAIVVLVNSDVVIDVAAPVVVKGRQIGWARVGIDRTDTTISLKEIARDGALYTLGAIIVGIIFAYYMGLGLSRGIYRLTDVASSVSKGSRDMRADVDRVDELGKLANVFNIMLDLENEARQELLASERRASDFAEVASDWFWEMDADLKYTSISGNFEGITGYDINKVIGTKRWNFLGEGEEIKKWDRHKAELEAHLPFRDFEYTAMFEDKAQLQVSISGVPVFDDADQFIGYRGSAKNITARIKNERELEEAKEKAEKANEAKSDFLASMSHELRTPLNAILGFGQMLQFNPKEELTTTQSGYVDNILIGGNHLLNLINEILDLSQIEAEQEIILLEEIVAEQVIEGCIAQILPLAAVRGIKVVNQVEEGSRNLLLTDEMRFKQVMINLLSNAVKYNIDNGTIIVDCRKTKEEFLHISITDTGIGIAEKDHAKIFNIFQRLGGHSDVAREGHGIGLTICKHLTERLGGRIDFESKKDKGTVFWFELPLITNKEILIWNDTMRVGVDAIDKDHQKIISLTNKISVGCYDEKQMNDTIVELIEYTHFHFRREEAIMEVCDYPDLIEHRDAHQDIIAEVNKLAKNWRKNNDPEIQRELCLFLREWWYGHIMKADIEIAKYTRGKTQEIRDVLKNMEMN